MKINIATLDTHTYTHTHTHTHTHINIHIYSHICTHIHTHRHTHKTYGQNLFQEIVMYLPQVMKIISSHNADFNHYHKAEQRFVIDTTFLYDWGKAHYRRSTLKFDLFYA